MPVKRVSAVPAISLGPVIPAHYIFNISALPKDRALGGTFNGKIQFRSTPRQIWYEAQIAQAAALQHPWTGPWEGDLSIMITFHKKNRVHGDIDNLAKAVLDGIQERWVVEGKKRRKVPGVVMKNDKQVKSLSLCMHYGKQEYIEMIVTRFNNDAGEVVDFDSSPAPVCSCPCCDHSLLVGF